MCTLSHLYLYILRVVWLNLKSIILMMVNSFVLTRWLWVKRLCTLKLHIYIVYFICTNEINISMKMIKIQNRKERHNTRDRHRWSSILIDFESAENKTAFNNNKKSNFFIIIALLFVYNENTLIDIACTL